MLPLFTGLTEKEFTDIIAHVHMDFRQSEEGEVIAAQDEKCNGLIYLLKGTMTSDYYSPDGIFTLSETICDTHLIEPESLFGMKPRYTRSYICATSCEFVIVSKTDFINVMMDYRIVKTNIMNALCARVQRAMAMATEPEPDSVEKKIVRFIGTHSVIQQGTKNLQIKMEDLADIIRETRLNVSNSLKNMRMKQLIEQPRRSIIQIPEFNSLKNL